MRQQAGRDARSRWDIAGLTGPTLGWCTCGTPTTCRGPGWSANFQGYQAATGTPICNVAAPPLPDGSGATGGSLSASQSDLSWPALCICSPTRAEEAQRSLRWRRPDREALVRHRPIVVGSGRAGQPSRRMAAHPGTFSSPGNRMIRAASRHPAPGSKDPRPWASGANGERLGTARVRRRQMEPAAGSGCRSGRPR
jgi:hypothetical protein